MRPRAWLGHIGRYALAAASSAAALAIVEFTPLIDLSPSAPFFAAVMISSWFGGLGPGLLATVLSVLSIDVYLMQPHNSLTLDWGDLVRIGVFILAAVLISWLNEARKRLERSLRQQNGELVLAHRHKDEFLATLGHELRNPLSPILSGLHLLRLRWHDDETTVQVCEIAARQIRHMTRLVDDLLDVSRIARGKIRLQKERVDLKVSANNAVAICRPLMETRHHELTVSLPEQPIWVEADVTRLEQILVNLLNNAAKYTEPRGKIQLTLVREGDTAVTSVADNGIGIATDLLPQLFDLFSQGERSLERSEGGLGIGLSLVRGLVQLHDGTVEAHSGGLGQGSQFLVRLPLLQERPQVEAVVEETAEHEPFRILVVDDDLDAAQMLAMLLEMWGHHVRTVHDGSSALEELPEFEPHVVLLDIGLPRMDGYEVARRIREIPRPLDVVLVALTGYAQEEDRRRSQEAGFDHHLVKPVDVNQLERLLLSFSTPRVSQAQAQD